MNDPAADLTIVRVFMTDNLVGQEPHRQPAVQLWVAAVPRDEAVAAVLKRVPSHYKAELTDDFVNFDLARLLDLKPGEVSELSSAR
ncbi:MAG: hypothetical protein E5V22_09070 [Mesorhizobium sp.]|nr:MAG: hypothetical protein E5V22_09070 [Mesorhizobium sp.]